MSEFAPSSPVIRRSALLGFSSVATLVAGFVTNKALASALGPEGLGLFAVARSLAWFLSAVTGGVLGSVLIREGAALLARGDSRGFHDLSKTAYRFALLSVGAGLVAVMARRAISEWLLASSAYEWLVVVCATTACLMVVGGIEMGTLAAAGNHRHLARTTMAAAVIGAVVAVGAARWFGVTAIGVVLVVPPLTTWLLARSRRELRAFADVGQSRATQVLFWAALPLTASTLLGGVVEFVLPLMLVQSKDTGAVGLFRSAYALALGSLGVVGAVLSQEYYPRLSALGPAESLSAHVNRQMRLVAAVAALFALIVGLCARPALALFFSAEFQVASPVLVLLLAVNLIRLPSWCLSYAVLARSRPTAYLGLEASGGAFTLGFSALGMALGDLRGLAAGLAVGYLAYFACAWVVLARTSNYSMDIGTRWRIAVLLSGAVTAGVLQLS